MHGHLKVKCNSFLSFLCAWNFRALKEMFGVAIDAPPRAPWTDRWVLHGTGHSFTDCQYCTKFSICYLNANVSTPVFMSHSTFCVYASFSLEAPNKFGKSVPEFGEMHSSVLGCERRPVSVSIMSRSCFSLFPAGVYKFSSPYLNNIIFYRQFGPLATESPCIITFNYHGVSSVSKLVQAHSKKFCTAIVRWENLLNTEGVKLKIRR